MTDVPPRRIMQSYFTRDLPRKMQECVDELKRLNTGYEYVFFDDKDSEAYLENFYPPHVLEAYRKVRPGAYKCDLFRVAYLLREGGWYLDISKRPLVGFDDWLQPGVRFYSILDGGAMRPAVWQAVLGVTPKHPLLEQVLDHIVSNILNGFYGFCPLSITGPVAWGHVFCQHYKTGHVPHGRFRDCLLGYKGSEAEHCSLHHKDVLKVRYKGWRKDRPKGNYYNEVYHTGQIYNL